jgi:hypothetical protein
MKQLIFILTTFFILSCDQDPELNFNEEIILQGYLTVGEPINNIRLTRTIPLTEKYDLEQSTVKDAEIIIKEGDNIFNLIYNNSTLLYEFDSNYVVKENTNYEIEIKTTNNKIITGETFTPSQIIWDQVFEEEVLQFPIDTLNPDKTERISWQYDGTLLSVNLTVRCLDTLNYGSYFERFNIGENTNEKNRRIERPWRDDFDFLDPVEYVILPGESKSTPVVWNSFKFYGLHEVTVYAPDFNWTRWGIQFYRNQYNELLSSVEGDGIGVFGSASVIRDTLFVIKNQQ